MKGFLTRIGFGSRAVVTGDVSQIDLPKGAMSGSLIDAERVLARAALPSRSFTSVDVVRHPLVARIVDVRCALPGPGSAQLIIFTINLIAACAYWISARCQYDSEPTLAVPAIWQV